MFGCVAPPADGSNPALMLLFLLAATLALLAASVVLPRAMAAPPQFWAHLVLAVGVMSLITAAMQHFVPVLSRSRGAGPWLARLPWLMASAGLAAALSFLGWLPYSTLTLAALLALLGVATLLGWVRRKGRDCLGPAHPGLAWYGAALGCLGLGLAAVLAMPVLPEWHGALRAFHLHINLYGFVGLTAVGTLQVLMPTVANRPDPAAARRLGQDLKWALAGALLLAVGEAAELAWLQGLGLAAWGWPLLRLASAWLRLYRHQILSLHGGEPVLMAALLGFAAALLGTVDGIGLVPGPLSIFLPGFLFALVSGAAGQLAPVWLQTGQGTQALQASQRRLGRYGGVRALLFLAAALLPLLGYRCAGMPGLTALIWFLTLFAVWLYRD
jgi:hypothetical protein